MTPAPVRTVFFGSGGFGIPSLAWLAAHPAVELVAIVTAPPRPAGRRGVLRATPIADAAPARVPVLTPARLRDPAALAEIAALGPSLAVLTDYGQLVPAPILELPLGALNLHPSLLPRHRGATPIPATILAGDVATGVTLIRMDAGIDTGPIVAQERVGLDGDETAPALEALLADVAASLLARNLGPWCTGTSVVVPQDDGVASMTRPLRRADGRLDPLRPAAVLERQVRAYQPWPGTFVETTEAGRLLVLAAEVGPVAAGVAPGTLTVDGLVTPNGILVFQEVCPAGGRAMPWSAYLRGHPAVVGTRVA